MWMRKNLSSSNTFVDAVHKNKTKQKKTKKKKTKKGTPPKKNKEKIKRNEFEKACRPKIILSIFYNAMCM